MSNNRININELEPNAYKAMMALENYGKTCALDPLLKELIKMRASQINGCAYCLDMHTEDALKLGEKPRRIFALSVWHESHLFSEKERVLLQLTEEVTKISEIGVTDETYKKVIDLYGEQMTAQIIMLIVTINAWNRIAVSTRLIYKG
ncbi:MAG: carboxymuconolactone decarboxylase family protein [Chitinophagaceae bacterium]|nr:carboxymuconolactone decarboxylase family protein [Chitinophagaceae bacterium]